MKKVICLTLMCLCVILFSGCLGCWNVPSSMPVAEKISENDADGTEYESYQQACRHYDFVAAYDWIEKHNGNEDDKDYVFNAEMLYLTSLGTEEASNRIIYLLAEYQIPGEVVDNNTPDIEHLHPSEDENYRKRKLYIDGIKRFNKRCDNVLDMAITQENKELARKIIKLYKADINVVRDNYEYNDLWFGEPALIYVSKEAAQKKYDENFGEDDDKK